MRSDEFVRMVAARNEASNDVTLARAARRVAATVRDGEPDTRHDTIRALVARVDVTDDADNPIIRWAPIVDAALPLAAATVASAVPAARVGLGDDVRLIIGGADPQANRDQRLIDLIIEARPAHEPLIKSSALSLDHLAAEGQLGKPIRDCCGWRRTMSGRSSKRGSRHI